jgi:hypothetical protein
MSADLDLFGEPGPRKRFRRARSTGAEDDAIEAISALHAEMLLLREENSRLKAAQHQRADVSRVIDRARSLSSPDADADRHRLDDETAQLLVDGLVIRESLLEICQEIERSMVAFEAKLNALASGAVERAHGRVETNGRDAA